jgi:hypothetical protein
LFRNVVGEGENLERKIVAAIMGMVGGVLLMVCVVAPWITTSMAEISANVSGIDVLKGGQAEMLAPVLLLVGGILVLVGGIGKLAEKKVVGYLMPIGAVPAVVGWVWALKISIVTVTASATGVHNYLSYGIFVGVAGMILVGLGLLPPRK